jgi:quinol monooxygenase YgiN
MIQATIWMKIPSHKSGEVLGILRPVVDLCEADPGCLSCHICGDLRNKSSLLLIQLWNAEEDLDRHLRSNQYRNLLLAMELASKPPEIRFDTISSSTGIETIEKARNQTR